MKHLCFPQPVPNPTQIRAPGDKQCPQDMRVSGKWKQARPSPPRPRPQMAHLFQANMPPMVEAKMIARMTQQIMIMIFFCSSRQGKKKHMRIGSTVQSSKDRTHECGSGRGRGYEGGWRWIWLLEPGLFIHMSLLRGRFKAGPTALPEDACHVLQPAGYRDDRLTPFPPRASILNERTKFLWGQHLRSETHSNTASLCSLRVKPFSKIRTSDPSDRAHV